MPIMVGLHVGQMARPLTTSFLASLLVDGILAEGHKQGQSGYSTGRQL